MLSIYAGVTGQNIGIAYGTIFIVYKSRTYVPPSAFSTEWIDNVIIHEISHLFQAKDHDSWDTTEIDNFPEGGWYVTDWGDVSIMTYPNSGIMSIDADLLLTQIGADKAWFQLYNWLPEDIGDLNSGMTGSINNVWWG